MEVVSSLLRKNLNSQKAPNLSLWYALPDSFDMIGFGHIGSASHFTCSFFVHTVRCIPNWISLSFQLQGQLQQYIAELIDGMPKKCGLPRFEYGSTGWSVFSIKGAYAVTGEGDANQKKSP